MSEPIFFQLFECESSTYTYLIGDFDSREAALIDPVLDTVDRDLSLVSELGLQLKYVLDTHIHADHVTAAGELRKRTKAKTAVSELASVDCADIQLKDQQELMLGNRKIKVLTTPGHTNSCLCFLFENKLFSGDTLLIRGTGRTDFQQGSAEKLFESVHEKLFTLPDFTQVYPAHDYKGFTSSSIGLEKQFNPRLGAGKTKTEFLKIMSELKLAQPKNIQTAVPLNLACGQKS
jgi:sulfur dioxygenase